MDRGIVTSTSANNGAIIRRRMIRVKDETGDIYITIWNKKVNHFLKIN